MRQIHAAVVFAAWLQAGAWAQPLSMLTPQGYVSDFAGVLNPAHREELERYCRRLEALTGVELALVTVGTLQGEPIEDAANALFRSWKIGKKGKDEGVLLLLAVRDRRMRLEVGYGLEPILPDGYAGALLRSLRPLLRENQFGPAMLEAAHQIGSRVAQAKNVSLDASLPSRRQVREAAPAELLPLGLLLVVFVALWLGTRRRRRRFSSAHALMNPFWLPGAGWKASGGGFGGYDSQDTFGGFGGGDSGGGGASSDW